MEYGRIYLWQIKNQISTTSGGDEILSPIYAFRIREIGDGSTTASYHPVVQILQQVLSDDQFNSLFGESAQLDGYAPTGNYIINGSSDDLSNTISILNQISNGTATITNIQVQD